MDAERRVFRTSRRKVAVGAVLSLVFLTLLAMSVLTANDPAVASASICLWSVMSLGSIAYLVSCFAALTVDAQALRIKWLRQEMVVPWNAVTRYDILGTDKEGICIHYRGNKKLSVTYRDFENWQQLRDSVLKFVPPPNAKGPLVYTLKGNRRVLLFLAIILLLPVGLVFGEWHQPAVLIVGLIVVALLVTPLWFIGETREVRLDKGELVDRSCFWRRRVVLNSRARVKFEIVPGGRHNPPREHMTVKGDDGSTLTLSGSMPMYPEFRAAVLEAIKDDSLVVPLSPL